MLNKFAEPTSAVSRRRFFGGALVGAATLFTASEPVWADDHDRPNDPFIVLLKGLYQPAPQLPDLGLSGVNLADTSYITTEIYPVFGVPGGDNRQAPIGRFYVSFSNPVCMYDLPHGAIAMQFASSPKIPAIGFNTFVPVPDGNVGFFLEGTFELSILDATGIYEQFKGGHNHMVDRLHQLDAAGTQLNEHCFCNISTYQFP